MKFTILGSGGAMRIPRATCRCEICEEARKKGFPYKRLGQSLFLHDGQMLFDTPEDINEALNAHGIYQVEKIFYSHWHPDHTLGCRIIETLMDDGLGKQLDVYLPPVEGIDISINGNHLLDFYQVMGFCQKKDFSESIKIGKLTITPILMSNGFSYAFLIQEAHKKVVYCPCHTKHLPDMPALHNADLMIVSKGFSTILNDDWTNFERDTLKIIEQLKPKKAIITHIEETDGIGFDTYKLMEKELDNIEFGYDGQVIEV